MWIKCYKKGWHAIHLHQQSDFILSTKLIPITIERTYIKVGVAAVDLGDRRAVVTSVDVQATVLE